MLNLNKVIFSNDFFVTLITDKITSDMVSPTSSKDGNYQKVPRSLERSGQAGSVDRFITALEHASLCNNVDCQANSCEKMKKYDVYLVLLYCLNYFYAVFNDV